MNTNPFENERMLVFPELKACLVRSVFTVGRIKKAELTVTALGYFEAFINGVPLSDDRLMPPQSDYRNRDLSHALYPIHDKMHCRIYYYRYDVAHLLREGENVLACHIGAGWYGQEECDVEGVGKWGDNCLVFKFTVTLEDGTQKVISQSDTKNTYRKSYITRTNIYYGECLDATLYQKKWNEIGFNDGDWQSAEEAALPDVEFSLADCPPDRVTGTTVPVPICEKDFVKIYDLGATLSGTPVIEFPENAKDGDSVSVFFADVLNEEMMPEFSHTGGDVRMQHDEFVYSRDFSEKYRIHFTWNAGRYIILHGNARINIFEEVRTDIKQRVFLRCENEVLQWFFDAFVRTQAVNIHGCIPSDCPHRERLGYTGDGQLCSAAAMYIFDSKEMYRKWMRDIRDCQDAENGHVQHTAPFYGGGGGPGGWGGAAVIVPWNFYRFFGEKDELKASYPSMLRYIEYMHAHSDNFLVTREEEKGWCLGDWCPPHNRVLIPENFVNTFYFAECARLTLKAADVLDMQSDRNKLKEMFDGAINALYENFFDASTGSFCGGVQGADAFALHLGIGDGRTKTNLVEKYSTLRRFDTGIFGTYFLLKTLFDIGENELAFDILTNRTEHSFFNMMKHGSANLWENWDGCDSRCHPMFGAAAEFAVSKILGIDEHFFDAGCISRTVKPAYIPSSGDISARISTADGEYRLTVSYNDGKQTVKLTGGRGLTPAGLSPKLFTVGES